MKFLAGIPLFLLVVSCSPLKTSQHDERYQWELTLHEVQTNLDDLRHDTSCFKAEIQILEGRIKSFENAMASFKAQDLEKQQARIDQIANQLQALEKKWFGFEKKQDAGKESLDNLSQHAKETNMSLFQFKSRMEELEKEIITQNRKLETLGKLKGNIEALTKAIKNDGQKVYKVRPGDSLEKIAKANKTDVATLKQLNQLQQDLIVVDQEIKIP